MEEIINKFLLLEYIFIPEMHLRQPVFTYSACGPIMENKKRMQMFKETGHSRHIYRSELDKACF